MLADAKEEASIYSELQKNYGDTFGRIIEQMHKDQGGEVRGCHIVSCRAELRCSITTHSEPSHKSKT